MIINCLQFAWSCLYCFHSILRLSLENSLQLFHLHYYIIPCGIFVKSQCQTVLCHELLVHEIYSIMVITQLSSAAKTVPRRPPITILQYEIVKEYTDFAKPNTCELLSNFFSDMMNLACCSHTRRHFYNVCSMLRWR